MMEWFLLEGTEKLEPISSELALQQLDPTHPFKLGAHSILYQKFNVEFNCPEGLQCRFSGTVRVVDDRTAVSNGGVYRTKGILGLQETPSSKQWLGSGRQTVLTGWCKTSCFHSSKTIKFNGGN